MCVCVCVCVCVCGGHRNSAAVVSKVSLSTFSLFRSLQSLQEKEEEREEEEEEEEEECGVAAAQKWDYIMVAEVEDEVMNIVIFLVCAGPGLLFFN